ncbi:hypothetical protein QBC35DRAFT_538317 [Podospora australis]|uniref:Ubiquitin-like domain-containing protein n=1 Tax=Podospora australis TaxID=1536484 RepID=A0AAN7AFB7_9PEZI|nr:hypothetical protein QBC35DRAFT_538317 [Podospora australis]
MSESVMILKVGLGSLQRWVVVLMSWEVGAMGNGRVPSFASRLALSIGAVGDFISIALLIKDIISALDDSRGSSKTYADLVQSITNLQQALQEVERVYQNPADLPESLSDLRVIALGHVGQIKQCLENYCSKTSSKYGPSLAGNGSGSVLRDVSRKTQWRLLEEKDAEKFREEVRGYTMSLKILVQVTTVRMLQENHKSTTKQLAESEERTAAEIRKHTRRLENHFHILGGQIVAKLGLVVSLCAGLQGMVSLLCATLGLIAGDLKMVRAVFMRIDRRGMLSDEHFVLEDATGRAFPIPLKTITSWGAFEYILAEHSKGKKCERRIRTKEYLLHESSSHQEIDRSAP